MEIKLNYSLMKKKKYIHLMNGDIEGRKNLFQ